MKTKVDGKDIQNNCWYNPHVIDGEVNEEASLTQPGMTFTIQEILEKHARGINLPVVKKSVFENADINSPEIGKIIDVTEAEELLTEVNQKIEESKKTAQNSAKNEQDLSGKIPSGGEAKKTAQNSAKNEQDLSGKIPSGGEA